MGRRSKSKRRSERGQTILLVAISIVSLLAMAALAIDVVTFYVARSEIQRAADAAALAGAKAIADSGVTTLQPSDPNLGVVEGWAATAANAQIAALLPVNTVAGRALSSPPVVTVDYTTHGNGNPLITVTLQQINLPTFFARIWGHSGTTVQASATAEAYNPSNNSSFTTIAPTSVKPWLVANADPNTPFPPGKVIIDSSNNVESGIVGSTFNITVDCAASTCSSPSPDSTPGWRAQGQVDYLPALVSADVGSNVGSGCMAATSNFEQAIECADVTTVYNCGPNGASWDNSTYPGGATGLTATGTEILINATGTGPTGQDTLTYATPYPASPPQITVGTYLSPFSGLPVTTSRSIVTIPILDTTNFSPTSASVGIVGFLQAFINQVDGLAQTGPPASQPGDVNITVLNVAACYGGGSPPAVVGGSGTSPVPVRLITSP